MKSRAKPEQSAIASAANSMRIRIVEVGAIVWTETYASYADILDITQPLSSHEKNKLRQQSAALLISILP